MTEQSQSEQAAARNYLREFLPAVLGYSIALLAIVFTVDFKEAGWWKYPVALLPVLPALGGMLAISRHIRRVDEMQRSIMLEGITLGFGLSMVASMTIGFLSISGLDVNQWGPWVIYSIGMLGWVGGQTRSSRKRQ